jgi:hypothetical protein
MTLSSYVLIGIEAVPVDVVVDCDQASVVDPAIGRLLRSVRPDKTESVSSAVGHVVNARTAPDRNLAPASLVLRVSQPWCQPTPRLPTHR